MLRNIRRSLRSVLHFNCTNSAALSSSSELPPPIRVGYTADAGRGVFATRRIQSGDLIHTEEPLVVHPSLDILPKVCYYCLRRLGRLKLHISAPKSNSENKSVEVEVQNSDCIYFCTIECRQRGKGIFEVESKADMSLFHKHCSKGLRYPLLVKRLACIFMSGSGSIRDFEILQPANHSQIISPEWEDGFQLLANAFKESSIMPDLYKFLTKDWYINAWLRIHANVFRIELIGGYADLLQDAASCVSSDLFVGNAVYALASMYNHDCDPNTHILWIEDAKARIKALRDIEAGEELRICYIDTSMEYEARRSTLYHGYGFHCKCARCKSKE